MASSRAAATDSSATSATQVTSTMIAPMVPSVTSSEVPASSGIQENVILESSSAGLLVSTASTSLVSTSSASAMKSVITTSIPLTTAATTSISMSEAFSIIKPLFTAKTTPSSTLFEGLPEIPKFPSPVRELAEEEEEGEDFVPTSKDKALAEDEKHFYDIEGDDWCAPIGKSSDAVSSDPDELPRFDERDEDGSEETSSTKSEFVLPEKLYTFIRNDNTPLFQPEEAILENYVTTRKSDPIKHHALRNSLLLGCDCLEGYFERHEPILNYESCVIRR